MILMNIHFNFGAIGADAWILFAVGLIVVFVALMLLFLAFSYVPKLLAWKPKKKRKTDAEEIPEVELTADVNAAISMALYLYFNQYHDEESMAMTIKRESRLYSPWSSKIYQVRNQFNRI